MKDLFHIAEDYILGRPIYRPLIRILNLLFLLSISSFAFEKFFGKYFWLDISDYKGILDFFFKGNFFIPFSIFIITFGIIQFSSNLIFSFLNNFKKVKIKRLIKYHYLKKQSFEKKLEELNRLSPLFSTVRLTKKTFLELYGKHRDELNQEVFAAMEKELSKPKESLEATFHLVFKAICALSIYYYSIPNYSSVLFISAIVLLILALLFILFCYRILEIIPIGIEKLFYLAEAYYKEHHKDAL